MERNGAVIKASELETVMVAAERIGVSRRRIDQMMREGKLDYYKIGHRKLVHRRDIDRLLKERAKRKAS